MPGKRKADYVAPVRVPTDIDVAWIAGLYEGEGTCYEGKNRSVMTGIYQKDPEILYRCLEMFGGRISQMRHHTPDKVCNVWNLGGDEARMFLQIIYPFMSARRKVQIDRTSFRSFTGKSKLNRPAMTEERKSSLAVMSAHEKLQESRRIADSKRSETRKAVYWYKKFGKPLVESQEIVN
jgi:hypothetical protein